MSDSEDEETEDESDIANESFQQAIESLPDSAGCEEVTRLLSDYRRR